MNQEQTTTMERTEDAVLRTCPNCQQALSEEQKFCPHCGAEYKAPEPPAEPKPRLCPKCGQELAETQKFCFMCGAEYKEPEPPVKPKPRLCPKCGQVLSEEQKFCANCGTEYTESVAQKAPVRRFCPNCSLELHPGQTVCTACLTPYKIPEETTPAPIVPILPITPTNASPKAKFDIKKKPLIISCVAILLGIVILAIVLANVLKDPVVTSIKIDKETVTLLEGETTNISCTVLPRDAANKKITYTSSDTSVAKVDEYGKITAIKKGTCTITASIGEITATVTVTVNKKLPDLRSVYNSCCSSTIWSTLGSDNSYIQIDTNPYDYDDGDYRYSNIALTAVQNINKALGLPESLYNDMLYTTWSMGKQESKFPEIGIMVTWTYHPDKGLEVSYKLLVD